jgi:hypothetical protein
MISIVDITHLTFKDLELKTFLALFVKRINSLKGKKMEYIQAKIIYYVLIEKKPKLKIQKQTFLKHFI